MSTMQRRIVITGRGAVTPVGTGNASFWRGLSAGKSGVLPVRTFNPDGGPLRIAAEVRDFDPAQYIKQKKQLKVMAQDIKLAVGAAQIAVDDARLDPSRLDPTRFGVNCGAGLIATDLTELGKPVST
ncbi:MAG: beta-ketoacyl synthase N-terminal-like domain-containing protein, partial [Planctomycetia bacterium]